MIAHDRRTFLKGGSFVIGALAASSGAATAEEAEPNAVANIHTAGFGWEACNLSNNGADIYVEVGKKMILQGIDIDVSSMICGSGPSGQAEVLCHAGVCQERPSFSPSAAAYLNLRGSEDFGPLMPDNPNGLDFVQDGVLLQDRFFAVILKTWAPPDGSASSTARHVSASPDLHLNAGNYLAFHMDHSGVPVDAEMQVVIKYQLA